MPEEVGSTLDNLNNITSFKYGDLEIYSGELICKDFKEHELLISIAWSGWGKVSSARAATRIINSNPQNKPIDILIFTGVAGSTQKDINQWDIVIASETIQHDMDARPLFGKYVIPALKEKEISPNPKILDYIYKTLQQSHQKLKSFGFGSINKGTIATGDQFISEKKVIEIIKKEIPKVLAVEMEGAAIAQVAEQEKIPWVLLRVISDNADSEAPFLFTEFIENYNKKSWEIIKIVLSNLDSKLFNSL